MGKVWMAGGDADNAATATKLATPRSIIIDLGSLTAKYFDGSANITPGVKGVLSIANGGTGAATASGALEALGVLIELAKYLPLTGGTLTGLFEVAMEDDAIIMARNTVADRKALMRSYTTGAVDFQNCADGSNYTALRILAETENIRDLIKLCTNISGTRNSYHLFGEHNKPSGAYAGNGSTTSRTINIGGVAGTTGASEALFITSSRCCAIVGYHGAVYWCGTGTTPFYALNSAIKFYRGVLTIATDNVNFNGSGTNYEYRVL